jgi:hypothetical protein
LRNAREACHCAVNKPLYIAFLDLEKAFDHVLTKALRWTWRSLGVKDWAVKIIQAMYTNVQCMSMVSIAGNSEWDLEYSKDPSSVLSSSS